MSLLSKLAKSFSTAEAAPLNEPKTINEMPVSPFRVLQVGIPFYRDEACQRQVPAAHLIILQLERDKAKVGITDEAPFAVPTSKNYQPGQLVNWYLNHKKEYEGPVWYRSPIDGKIEKAWDVNHVEFDGHVVSQ